MSAPRDSLLQARAEKAASLLAPMLLLHRSIPTHKTDELSLGKVIISAQISLYLKKLQIPAIWGHLSLDLFFCTGASDVLLKDKTKKKFREPRSQDSQKISEVKKLGFKYCRKSHKALRLVSSELGETEISSVPNSEVNHLEYFIGSKESAETPAPKRALPGPPSDPRRAGR